MFKNRSKGIKGYKSIAKTCSGQFQKGILLVCKLSIEGVLDRGETCLKLVYDNFIVL